jgi:flagellin
MLGVRPATDTMLLFWLARNRAAEDQALERLASGKRINRGSDDPAGLVSATQLDAAIRALDAEVKITTRLDANANIADASLSQLSDLTSELNAALVRAANTAGLSPDEQAAAQLEVDQLVQSIRRFSDQSVESLAGVGLDDEQRQVLSEHLRSALSGLSSLTSGGENHLGSGNFETAQGIVREAMAAFGTARGTVGAFQKNTLAPRAAQAAGQIESLTAARSRIVDADFAAETANLVRARTLATANVDLLRIHRRNAAAVLSLLR